MSAEQGPDFGPRGYLPPKAARRARKIVLRGQMGIGWPLAAAAGAVVLVLVAVAYLLTSTGPPGPPLQAAGPILDLPSRGAAVVEAADGSPVLAVRGGGGVRVFAPPGGAVRACGQPTRLVADDGRVWTLDGLLVGGAGGSLRQLPSTVHAGVLYVDPSAPGPPAPADPRGESTTCP